MGQCMLLAPFTVFSCATDLSLFLSICRSPLLFDIFFAPISSSSMLLDYFSCSMLLLRIFCDPLIAHEPVLKRCGIINTLTMWGREWGGVVLPIFTGASQWWIVNKDYLQLIKIQVFYYKVHAIIIWLHPAPLHVPIQGLAPCSFMLWDYNYWGLYRGWYQAGQGKVYDDLGDVLTDMLHTLSKTWAFQILWCTDIYAELDCRTCLVPVTE